MTFIKLTLAAVLAGSVSLAFAGGLDFIPDQVCETVSARGPAAAVVHVCNFVEPPIDLGGE